MKSEVDEGSRLGTSYPDRESRKTSRGSENVEAGVTRLVKERIIIHMGATVSVKALR